MTNSKCKIRPEQDARDPDIWANTDADVGPYDFLVAFGFDKIIAANGGDIDQVAEALDPVGVEQFRDDYVGMLHDLHTGKVVMHSPEYAARRDEIIGKMAAVVKQSADVHEEFVRIMETEE